MPIKPTTPKPFALTKITVVLLPILFTPFVNSAYANPNAPSSTIEYSEESEKLSEISVTAEAINTAINSTTTKTAKKLTKEQTVDIRDLVRYDPGVSVVEQNNGASSGYQTRGVDKNRVAITVDGINQTQSYVMQGGGGGSINEIDNESINKLVIYKGGAGTEFGSGALGGAVAFSTKTPDDILKGKKFRWQYQKFIQW